MDAALLCVGKTLPLMLQSALLGKHSAVQKIQSILGRSATSSAFETNFQNIINIAISSKNEDVSSAMLMLVPAV
tara:strand:+ start:234 stop:455 length:222 start_codon:yes stop_codon:yes gene_type:complete